MAAGLVGSRLRRSVVEERHDGRDRDADDDRGCALACDFDRCSARREHADVVARVLPGVVNVRTVGFDGNKGEGSGVVIDRRGVILTNNHVIRGARTVTVSFNDGRHESAVKGTVIGTAAKRDLAIIRVGAAAT